MVRVAASKAGTVAQRLTTVPEISTQDPSSAVMTWTRYSVRRGDDDEVVDDLSRALGGLAESVRWKIDWQASAY